MSADSKRVVITGAGIVSPIGTELDTVWENLDQGKSGIGPIENLPTDALPFDAGGEVRDFSGAIEDYGPLEKKLLRAIKKGSKIMCREIEMGVAASQKAITNSGLPDDRVAERCGCIFGCDYILTRPEEYEDGMRNCLAENNGKFELNDWPEHGLGKVNPLWLLKYLPNMPNSHVAIYNDFRGPNNAITTREASMGHGVAEATSIIKRGAADVMLVGATGSRIHPLRTAQVVIGEQLASQQSDPTTMVKPFDQAADGTALGEGAGALILESLEYATSRGAKILGEVIGHGAATVGPNAGENFLEQSSYRSLKSAIESCGDRLPENWHLHANGLGCPDVDAEESRAIGKTLQGLKIPVTAAKSYFGNLGCGGVAIELICSLLALQNEKLFPIRNLSTPAEHVTWHPATAGDSPGNAFIHNSFTLQGQTVSLAISKFMAA